ncbi:MAG: FAD-dependent oxidoreductase [Gammaproteobacteria bacterium]|nr:FAD-dependent oxidoreductase [Gammaproteobacteria bacterium]
MGNDPVYDVLIIGGGVSGTALLYELAQFTDLKHLALVEKYDSVAAVNSNACNNSQTLHCGDIETNYTLEKAVQVKKTADMLVSYTDKLPQCNHIIFKHPKMVISVGEQESEVLKQRYDVFKQAYPSMRYLQEDEIEKLEPNVLIGRTEKVNAISITDEYTAVNFAELSESFIVQAQQQKSKDINVSLSTYVENIEQEGDTYRINTDKGTFNARFVVVCAGGHSLLFAHRMGYGLEYSCLPMAGSFYYVPKLLNGKVYTMQNDKLPFAALHGDPDILIEDKTRIGPTALVVPMLERHKWKTLPEFFQSLRFDHKVVQVFWDLLKVADIRNYIIRNILFEVPFIRRRLFLQDAHKIIPSLRLKDLRFARGIGGVRPVMVDKKNRKLHLGEAKIDTGKGLVFNMTPSPGATSCLGNAEKDMRIIADYLGCKIDEQTFREMFPK